MNLRLKPASGLLALAVAATATTKVNAEIISIFDSNFSFLSVPINSEFLSARWGIWDGSQFIQITTNSSNTGYVEFESPEIFVGLTQVDNTIYTAGNQLALAFYTDGSPDAQTLNWSPTSGFGAVLTDTSWIVPTFANNANIISYNLSANTIALVGAYSFNGGNEVITLAPIPEPATFAAFAGMAMLGLAVVRRRKRSV